LYTKETKMKEVAIIANILRHLANRKALGKLA